MRARMSDIVSADSSLALLAASCARQLIAKLRNLNARYRQFALRAGVPPIGAEDRSDRLKVIAMLAGLAALGILVNVIGISRAGAVEAITGPASIDNGRPTRFDGRNYHGRLASGERFDAKALAVAHRDLPLGSHIAVQYGDRIVLATVNDRGPCATRFCRRHAPMSVRKRVLDMTPALARKLKFPGLGQVTFWPVQSVAAR